MTKKFRIGAAGVAMFAALGMGSAAQAQSATADANAEILEALLLTNNSALDFGTLVVDGAGTVTIAAAPLATAACAGDVICSGTSTPANFTVDGSDGRVVEVNLPPVDGELRHTGFAASAAPEHNIDLDDFTQSSGTVTLTGGTADFDIGGRLTLDGSEIEGAYTTTFEITVNYQ
ncbi:MAG: DUF4402 domain-containing protein [Pseudomonadota bacterium]